MTAAIIKLIIISFYLILILFIVAFNLLYLTRAMRGEKFAGLHPPVKIAKLVKTSTYLAVFTVFLLALILIFRIY